MVLRWVAVVPFLSLLVVAWAGVPETSYYRVVIRSVVYVDFVDLLLKLKYVAVSFLMMSTV